MSSQTIVIWETQWPEVMFQKWKKEISLNESSYYDLCSVYLSHICIWITSLIFALKSHRLHLIVKLQPDLEPNLNELEQTWTSRVRSWLCFPMSQEEQEQEQEEAPHLIYVIFLWNLCGVPTSVRIFEHIFMCGVPPALLWTSEHITICFKSE